MRHALIHTAVSPRKKQPAPKLSFNNSSKYNMFSLLFAD